MIWTVVGSVSALVVVGAVLRRRKKRKLRAAAAREAAEREELAPKPQHFDMHAWGPLVRWSAEEQQLTFDADARVAVIRLAAAPVKLDERLIGVLSVARQEGLDRGRETIRSWLPRHATQVGR